MSTEKIDTRYMSQNISGSITLYIGPMFAGKTSEMLRGIDRHRRAGRRCITVRYTHDNRYKSKSDNGVIVTHSGWELPDVPVVNTQDIEEIIHILNDYDVIGVSEVQFMKNLMCLDQLANRGKIIICDGLDGDYRRDNFGRLHELIPRCENVVKLAAVCEVCGQDAGFTKKLIVGGPLEDIGGRDKYVATCRKCHQLDVDVINMILAEKDKRRAERA